MTRSVCSVCGGRGRNVVIDCPDCEGTGMCPNDENPYGQCHTCYGEGEIEEDECSWCGGDGFVDI